MRIVACHVDGFGLLHDLQVERIGPGTTVVLGPNEAGKSTLQRFLAMTLVGYPRRNDARGRSRHAPLRGGRHGGWVAVEDDDGGLWRVERVPDRSPSLRVVHPDGHEEVGASAADDLVPPHVDLDRFEQVHAVDLDALTGLGRLDGASLDELLYDAATVGAGRSLRSARAAAEQRRDALWTPTATTRPVPRAVAARDRARADLRSARAAARGAVGLRDELDRVGTRLADLEQQQEDVAAEHELLARVVQAWPHHRRSQEAAARAARLPERPLATDVVEEAHAAAATARAATAACRRLDGASSAHSPDPQHDELHPSLAAVGDEVVDAAARLADHRDRVAALRAASDDAAAAREAVTGALAAIGPDWTAAAVDAVRTDAPTTERLQVTAAAVVDARRRQAEVRARLALAVVEHDDVTSDAPGDRPPVALVGAIGAMGAAVLLLGVAAAVVAGPGPEAITAAALGVAVLLALLVRAVRGGRVVGPHRSARRVERAAAAARHRTGLEAQLAAVADELDTAQRAWLAACEAAGLAGDDDPGVVRVRHGRVVAAAGALAEARRAADRRDRRAARVGRDEREVAALLARAGIRDEHTEDSVLLAAAAARVRAASRTGAALAAARARREQLAEDHRRARAAVQAADDELAAALARAGVADLDELDGRRLLDERRRQELVQERTATGAVRVLLGDGLRAERARALLDQADPAAWDARRGQLAERVSELAAERDELLREQTRLHASLGRAADDDAVPRAGLALAAAQAELDEVARSWVVADAAARVLAQAVATHERDRHPRVLARAGALLAQATLGEWTVLRRRGERLVAQRSDDELPVGVDVLSRGTQEQLYLCLRLALAGETSRRDGTALPVLVDDLGGATDPRRAVGVARVLAATARHQQVWLFTCDPRTADVVTEQDPAARVLALDRGGELLGWQLRRADTTVTST